MATQGVLTFVEPFIPVVFNLFSVTPPLYKYCNCPLFQITLTSNKLYKQMYL